MRIIVESPGERRIHIRIPTAIVLNRLTAKLFTKAAKRHLGEGSLETRDLYPLLRAVRQAKRRFPKWELVNLQEADGEHIQIRL